jgi:hypothetical protein
LFSDPDYNLSAIAPIRHTEDGPDDLGEKRAVGAQAWSLEFDTLHLMAGLEEASELLLAYRHPGHPRRHRESSANICSVYFDPLP